MADSACVNGESWRRPLYSFRHGHINHYHHALDILLGKQTSPYMKMVFLHGPVELLWGDDVFDIIDNILQHGVRQSLQNERRKCGKQDHCFLCLLQQAAGGIEQ